MQGQEAARSKELKQNKTYPAAPVTMAFLWCSLPIWMLLMVSPLLAGGAVEAMILFVLGGSGSTSLFDIESK